MEIGILSYVLIALFSSLGIFTFPILANPYNKTSRWMGWLSTHHRVSVNSNNNHGHDSIIDKDGALSFSPELGPATVH